ncbi:Mitochondrial inner membrane protease subunit 2, partial [Ophiophagus hannah]
MRAQGSAWWQRSWLARGQMSQGCMWPPTAPTVSQPGVGAAGPGLCLYYTCAFITFFQISLGLLHARATHILWPPERWQKLQPKLFPERQPLQHDQE